jgi:acyl-coenzyme A thioesterase PaaI-like protein
MENDKTKTSNKYRRYHLKSSNIPFVNLVGIEQDKEKLSLDFKDNILNHIETIHASAQFALAETQSGMHLQTLFPELEGKVLPVLRDAQIKYKKPAIEKIVASASVSEEVVEKFKVQYEKKRRGSIQIDVNIKDINDVLTCQATFTWFVQAL